LVYIELIVDSV